jgi:hypothetical protein
MRELMNGWWRYCGEHWRLMLIFFSLSVDGELRKAMMELPSFFQPDPSDHKIERERDRAARSGGATSAGTATGATGTSTGTGANTGPTSAPPSSALTGGDPRALVQYYEKIMLNIAIHSRMLRLHRPWLSRGYQEERFAYSKEQCIRAARATLRMMSDTHGTAAFLEKWW